MQRLIMDLWHEVETTVIIVTHSIAEAVYLGDRVWVMAADPGRIAREFKDGIPKTRDADPMAVQDSAAFKAAVAEVGKAFREVEAVGEAGLANGGRAALLLGLREGRVLAARPLAGPGGDAAHPDAARLLRPGRLRQPRLLAARPRRDRGLRRRPLVERAVPEAGRGRAPGRARGHRRGPDEGGLRAAGAGVAGPLPGARGRVPRDPRPRRGRRARAASPTSGPATSTRCCRSSCACSPRARRSPTPWRGSIAGSSSRASRTCKARLAAAGDPEGAARAVAEGHPRDPGEAPRQPRHRGQQRGGDGRRARADRAAGAPRARGERGEPLAGGALRPARRRLPDPRRDLALPGPARGHLLRRVHHRLRDRLRAPPAARARRAGSRRRRPPRARPAPASARGSDDSRIEGRACTRRLDG